jgi:hypothetical protein
VEPSPRTFGWALGLGVMTIGILLFLGITASPSVCGNGDLPPTLAFQLARSPADLDSIFGASASYCRYDLVQGMKLGTKIDLFIFIPVYSAFLGVILAILNRQKSTIAIILGATLVATVAGDLTETITQLQILDNIEAGPNFLVRLMIGNVTKTAGLALLLLGIAFRLWRQQSSESFRSIAIILALLALVRQASLLVEDLQPVAPLCALAAYVLLSAYVSLQLADARRTKVVSE